jgi:hypothetical protein
MGLWSAIKSVGKGEFKEGANFLFMDEDAIATTNEVSNAQEALVKERHEKGLISDAKAGAYLSEIQRNAYPYLFDEYGGPSDAFTESIKTDLTVTWPNKIRDVIDGTVGGASKFLLRAIPWYIWIILLIALAIYISPYLKLLGSLRPKSKT